MHAQILESYATDEDEFFSFDESEDDCDAESHLPLSASETRSTSTASINEPEDCDYHAEEHGNDGDFDVETPVIRDELETPVETVNRGTFGYGTPIVRRFSSQHELEGGLPYLIDNDDSSTHPGFPGQWCDIKNFKDRIEPNCGCEGDPPSFPNHQDSSSLVLVILQVFIGICTPQR